MMRLFFGWLRGVETVERPVVKEQLGTIALHCGNDEAEQLGTIALHWGNNKAEQLGTIALH
jgi:hypothetical protein